MDHDLDVLFDQCTTRKHFQELPMLGEVTKKTEASPPTHTPLETAQGCLPQQPRTVEDCGCNN